MMEFTRWSLLGGALAAGLVLGAAVLAGATSTIGLATLVAWRSRASRLFCSSV